MSDFFNNLKLRKKILLAPVVVLFFLFILGAGTFYSILVQQAALDDIFNKIRFRLSVKILTLDVFNTLSVPFLYAEPLRSLFLFL